MRNAGRAGLQDFLRALDLDAVYERAEGDYLFQRRGSTLIPVLDLIGGFGTTLLGHNHPGILDEWRRLMEEKAPFSSQVSSGLAAAKLESLLRSRVGVYRQVLTNSGSETVEAALKHAYLERRQPTFWAVRGAFHGVTLGALQLTDAHRETFQCLGPQVRVLDPWDRSSWEKYGREVETVSGAIIEPILGEGGIVPLPAEFLRWLAGVCRTSGIPLIADEIQTGMGRSGTFLACQKLGLDPDYICLSKALGGGVAKIGALLIKEERYIESFSLLHASTFAGDEISSRIACRVMEIIDRDGIPDRCQKLGDYLLARLLRLQKEYPDQIADVRGQGLLIGIQLAEPPIQNSNFLRAVAEHDLLGGLASSYLLSRHDIRVAPSLNNPSTLRIEPSAYVAVSDLNRFVDALQMFLEAVRHEDVPHLIGHLIGRPRPPTNSQPLRPCLNREKPSTVHRVAFIAHAIDARDVASWDPSLTAFDADQLSGLTQKAAQFLGPVVYDELHVHSPLGPKAHLSLIGLFYTSEQLFRAYRSRHDETVIKQIEKAIELAGARGCTVAGLGGFHSIITQNGKRLRSMRIGLTSGNALTVGMGTRALVEAAARNGMDVRGATLGVVGATGNIGQAYALVMAAKVRRMVLITRKGGSARCVSFERRLREVAPAIETDVSESLDALQSCSLIVAASNVPEPIVHSHHLGGHGTVICDISLPPNVSSEVTVNRPDVVVVKGGLVRLPCDANLRIPGLPLAPGHVFACLAETLLMGLEGIAGNGSYGALAPENVEWALALADKHQFLLAEPQLTGLLG